MQLAQLVPEKAFIAWHLIPRFMLLTAKPVLASSGAVVTKLQGSVSSGSSHSRDLSQVERTRERIETEYGLPKDVQAELATLTVRFLFQEQSVGANDEALQCLRKGPRRTWGKCEDYALFVKELADAERRAGRARLKIQAYFAEEDSMIGKKGQRYVEECFSRRQDVLDFESITVPGVDHDGLSQCAEVLNSVFREVATQT